MGIKKAKVTIEANALIWDFADGTQVKVDPEDFTEEVMRQAMFHGFKQKLSDTYAGAVTVTEAKAMFENTLKGMQGGTWNAGRSGNGGVWVEALARAANVEVDVAREKWNEMDDEGKKAIKADAQVKLAKAQIDMERASVKAEGAAPLEL